MDDTPPFAAPRPQTFEFARRPEIKTTHFQRLTVQKRYQTDKSPPAFPPHAWNAAVNRSVFRGFGDGAVNSMLRMEFHLRPPSQILRDLQSRTELFDLLVTSAGVSSAEFENRYTPLINSLASYLLETPLERTAFAEPGGALRFALTAATFALNMAARMIFAPNLGSEMRRALDKQYKFAGFAATIATIPTLVHTKVQVSSGPNNAVWSPFHPHPHLEEWVRHEGDGRTYDVLWRTADSVYTRSSSVAISAEIFQRGFWSLFHPMVVQDMYEAIAPYEKVGREGPLWLCVYEGLRMARQHEQKSETAPYVPTVMPVGITPASLAAATQPQMSSPDAAAANPIAVSPQAPAEALQKPSGTAGNEKAAPATASHPQDTTTEPVGDPTAAANPAVDAQLSPELARAVALARKLPIVLREIFEAVPKTPDYPKLQAEFKIVDDGIEMPLKTLYGLGLNPSLLFEQLKANELVVRKSAAGGGGARIVLVPEVQYLLKGDAFAHL